MQYNYNHSNTKNEQAKYKYMLNLEANLFPFSLIFFRITAPFLGIFPYKQEKPPITFTHKTIPITNHNKAKAAGSRYRMVDMISGRLRGPMGSIMLGALWLCRLTLMSFQPHQLFDV